jgi:hypothetical protein
MLNRRVTLLMCSRRLSSTLTPSYKRWFATVVVVAAVAMAVAAAIVDAVVTVVGAVEVSKDYSSLLFIEVL